MRYLGMQPRTHQYWLDLMNQSAYKSYANDSYNQGPLFTTIEQRVAKLLAKPQAMFFNKGTTCQLAALKTICERKNNNRIILHPKSHIAIDEQNAYQDLMNLTGVLLGNEAAPFVAVDLNKVGHEVAALVVELPLRRVGFKLTSWAELLKMRQWCDANQVHFHLDGARLWESTHYYQKSLAEIAALFDSVYVSLYKGIGGLSGALLAGDENFLSQCAVWRNRLGSNMYCAFPALITGLEGLDNNLPKISSWVERAHEIYQAINGIDGLTVESPHSNAFQIKTHGKNLNQQLELLQDQCQMVVTKPFAAIDNQHNGYFTELQVGQEHQTINTAEIVDFMQKLVNHAST